MALVLTMGMFAGCGKTEDPTKPVDPAEKPAADGLAPAVDKDTIVIATMSETPSLSPTEHNAVAGDYMNQLTFSTLFATDMELKPVPSLAESYSNLSDTEWEIKLKKDVKFHDGTTMTADDVVASLLWAKGFSQVSLYNDDILNVEKTGDLTIKITTAGPDAILLNNLTHHGNAIVPKALIDAGNDFNKNPIGTGPYMFKDWTLGDSLTFEAFPDYFEGEPAIKNMVWKIIPEGASRTIALEAHEIDFIVEVEAMDAARIEENENLVLYKYDATDINWLMLNNERPGLDNADVRHAMNSAIDKDSIVTVAANGLGVAALSQSPMNLPGASEANSDKFDVAKAKEFMDKSGVAPADVKFSIIASNDMKKRAAEVIQADLDKNLGIKCEIESMDLATYLSATSSGDYTASIGGYSSTSMVSYLIGVYHSKSIGASNKTRINNPEVDALIDKASTTVDEAARNTILEECNAKLNELCSQIPLWQPTAIRAFNSQLQNVEINAGGNMFYAKLAWKE